MSRVRRWVALLALAAAFATGAATSQAHDPVTWSVIAGGGVARASVGATTLGATIGQPGPGTLAAGATTLRGGFWLGGASGGVGVGDGRPTAGPFRFFPARPNPVRAQSRVAFDLPRAAGVELSVFDVTGRAVQRWDYGVLPAGHHERTWSPADDRGRPIASGVYFLRLAAGGDQGVHKVLVLR